MDSEIVPNRLREVRLEQNEQIKDIRSRRPLKKNEVLKTLEYLAKTYGGDKAKYSKYETGESPIKAWVLLAYADEFNVSVDYLLNRSEAKSTKNYSAGHELGLSDEAVETLKLLKEISGVDMNPISVVNAFLNDKKASYEFFESLFQNIVTEFRHKQTKKSQEEWMYNSGLKKLENAYEIIIRNFVRNVVIPGLKDSIKKACEYNDMLLELQNDPTYYESD